MKIILLDSYLTSDAMQYDLNVNWSMEFDNSSLAVNITIDIKAHPICIVPGVKSGVKYK